MEEKTLDAIAAGKTEEAPKAVIKTPKRRRLCVAMPKNMDKFELIEAAMRDYFDQNGITSEGDRRRVIFEMAIDLFYAKPEIEERLGKEEVAALMAQRVKRFV